MRAWVTCNRPDSRPAWPSGGGPTARWCSRTSVPRRRRRNTLSTAFRLVPRRLQSRAVAPRRATGGTSARADRVRQEPPTVARPRPSSTMCVSTTRRSRPPRSRGYITWILATSGRPRGRMFQPLDRPWLQLRPPLRPLRAPLRAQFPRRRRRPPRRRPPLLPPLLLPHPQLRAWSPRLRPLASRIPTPRFSATISSATTAPTRSRIPDRTSGPCIRHRGPRRTSRYPIPAGPRTRSHL